MSKSPFRWTTLCVRIAEKFSVLRFRLRTHRTLTYTPALTAKRWLKRKTGSQYNNIKLPSIMTLNLIIHAWENNALPKDLDVLKTWKKEIDNCEKRAFEVWRITTNNRWAIVLMNEQIYYADISQGINDRIRSLTRQRDYNNILNRPFTFKSAH